MKRYPLLRYKNIFIGNKCNNKCLHCNYRHQETQQPDLSEIFATVNIHCRKHSLTLPYPSFKKEDYKNTMPDSYSEQIDGIAFYGGEPTLRRDLLDIISKASSEGYRRIKLVTNGRALSDINFLIQILNAGCYIFEIKLWASRPELHDYLTQIEGSFCQTMKGLENLAGHPAEKFVCVKILICNENYTDIENTVATVINTGANRIVLTLQDNKLSFQEAFTNIRNSIQISIFNRIWILTEGFPLCSMYGLEQHVSEIYTGWKTEANRIFEYHLYCNDCIYKEFCPGIDKRYLNIFGENNFSPIASSKHVVDIKGLYE